MKIDEIIGYIREMAPEELAEPRDNCGLLVASRNTDVARVAICLDATLDVALKAAEFGAGLIICHHPLIFSPLLRIEPDSAIGKVIYLLIERGIALYAAHTNADKTYGGLNDLLAGLVGLSDVEGAGCYRIGVLPRAYSPEEFDGYIKARLKPDVMLTSKGRAGEDAPGGASGAGKINRVAVNSGAYGIDAGTLISKNVDAVICGEMRHHEVLELAGRGIHVVCAGHHDSERFFISLVNKWLKDRFPGLETVELGYNDAPLAIY